MQGIVQRKNTMPILANVLLEANQEDGSNGQLVLSATDLDVGMRTTQFCEVMEAGRITIPARALSDIVRVLPGPDVTFQKMQNNHIEVKSGRTKARLLGLSADEYPSLPAYSDVSFTSFDAKLFVDMVEKTSYASSTDETRYNLNGVLVESAPSGADDPNQFVMVATDGHRLVHIERSFDGVSESGWSEDHQSVILPRKGLGELKRLIDGHQAKQTDQESEDQLQVGFHENHAVVKYGETILGMRLIDGAFPDYRQVIPKIADKIVRISRSDLSASLKRVSVLTSDKSQPVKLTLQKDQLTVSCANADMGEITDDVPVEYNGEDIEVAFNARYLADALNSMDDTNVLLKLTDGLSPGLLVGVDETHHLCVVMPMRW